MKHNQREDRGTAPIVYSFAAYLSKDDREKFREICFQYNRAYNSFIDIERQSLSGYRESRLAISTELADIGERVALKQSEIRSILDKIKQSRSKARERGKVGPDLKSTLATMREEMKQLKQSAKKLRDELASDPELVKQAVRLNTEKKLAKAKVRSEMGDLYWGARDLAAASAEMAAKGAIAAAKRGDHADRDPQEIGMPSFRRFDGSGRLAAIYTKSSPGGVPLRSALDVDGCRDTNFRMQPLPVGAFVARNGKVRPVRSLIRTKARIRVGSDSSRRPVWMDLMFVQHRPLPLDYNVSSITLVASNTGGRISYDLQFTVYAPRKAPPAKGAKKITLSVVRRTTDDGLLVAEADVDGMSVLLPPDMLEERKYLAGLQSTYDNVFDAAKLVIADRVANGSLPIDITESLAVATKLRSHRKLARACRPILEEHLPYSRQLWGDWVASRVTGRERSSKLDLLADQNVISESLGLGAVQSFCFWLLCVIKKLHHLQTWHTCQKRKMLGRRKHIFLNYAARLRDELGFGSVEFVQPKELTRRRPRADSDMQHMRAVQAMNSFAGAHELKSAIQNAFGKEHVTITSRADEPAESADVSVADG